MLKLIFVFFVIFVYNNFKIRISVLLLLYGVLNFMYISFLVLFILFVGLLCMVNCEKVLYDKIFFLIVYFLFY